MDVLSALFGGLAGSIYTQYHIKSRNAKQKITQQISITPFFTKKSTWIKI